MQQRSDYPDGLLAAIGCNELEAVEDAVRILQRHEKMATGVATQPERCNLFADDIGMVAGSRACGGPETGGPDGSFLCAGDGRICNVEGRIGCLDLIGLSLR